jgi:predicted dehydrogenase
MTKLKVGILGAAKIAITKVIPPMHGCHYAEPVAIASRQLDKAQRAAAELKLPRAYGSYDELLADPDIDVIYNPLPNHEHVPWTIRAAEAGKHVLCEKPLGMTQADAERLLEVRDRTGKAIQEAFMVRTHPQWHKVRGLVERREIGELRAITGHFSYHNVDPANVRNVKEWGGGGMLDIGCYPITTSRFVTGLEPKRVAAVIEDDPSTGIDRRGSVILDFGGFTSAFTYGTQMAPRQTMSFVGDKGRVDVEIPFNAPNDRPCRLYLDKGELRQDERELIEVPTCDQYGIMMDAFAKAIIENHPQPVPLEDSMKNMRVIDAVFRAARSGRWEEVAAG